MKKTLIIQFTIMFLLMGQQIFAQINQNCNCNLVNNPKATLSVNNNGVVTNYISIGTTPTTIPSITLPAGQTVFTGNLQFGYANFSCVKAIPAQPGYCNVPKTDIKISTIGSATSSYSGTGAAYSIPNSTAGLAGLPVGITTITVYGNCQSNITSGSNGGQPCVLGSFKFNIVGSAPLTATITLAKECCYISQGPQHTPSYTGQVRFKMGGTASPNVKLRFASGPNNAQIINFVPDNGSGNGYTGCFGTSLTVTVVDAAGQLISGATINGSANPYVYARRHRFECMRIIDQIAAPPIKKHL